MSKTPALSMRPGKVMPAERPDEITIDTARLRRD
jgi:hypothetical protein